MGADEGGYDLFCPFWVDTDAYTDRDRAMFTAGFEFAGLLEHIGHDDRSLSRPIHRENESRVRMACGRFGRRCKVEACRPEDDPAGTWSYLEVEAR